MKFGVAKESNTFYKNTKNGLNTKETKKQRIQLI